MDILREIFIQIPTKDLVEFENHIQKYKNKNNRKDLELIRLFTSKNELKPKEYIQSLYGSHKLNTYQALRKRLIKKLSVFITQKHMSDDQSSTSLISGYISIIQYMINQNNDFIAWTFMKKAEVLAIKCEHYDLLNTVYNFQVEHASSPYATDLNKIIEKKLHYRQLADEEEKYSMVYALVNQKLLELKHQNTNFNLDETINDLFNQNNINPIITEKPKAAFQLMKIARSSTIAKRDFHNLQSYIKKHYLRLLNNKAFNKTNHVYKLEILFMLSHSLYRSRDFNECMIKINELEKEISRFNNAYHNRFSVRTTMLKASVLAYTNNVEKAIHSTEQLISSSNIKDTERLGSYLNLGFYYFINNDLNKAAQISYRIGHTDTWCTKKMGQEWVLKKNLMEIIIQYELENYDLALNQIQLFKSHYREFIKKDLYIRIGYYIEFIRKLITDPNILDSAPFMKQMQEALISVPPMEEDLQAMAFYSWLKSKINKCSYYEALMDTIK